MNLLQNPSFELGWTDIPVAATVNQRPRGWYIGWLPIGAELKSAGVFPGDHPPVLEVALTIPECVHKHASQLPPDEQPGGEDALILDGEYVYKIFSNYNPFGATLYQVVHVPDGSRVTLRVPIQVHQHNDGSHGAATCRVCIDTDCTQWLTFDAGIDDRQWMTYTVTTTAIGGACSVYIDVESKAEAGIDFFIDDASLEIVEDTEPLVCRGAPRVQYARKYNVIRQDATDERAVEIFLAGWRRSRETTGGSYDDAGIGDLDERHAVLWDIPTAEQQAYRDFFATYYPEVDVAFDGDSGTIPPPPPPPPDGEPKPWPLRSDNHIGLHSGFIRTESQNYVRYALPTCQKFFSAGDAWRAKVQWANGNPGFTSVWRKYVGDHGIDSPREQAQWYVDQYTAEINVACAGLGLTVEQLLAGIDVVESFNETIPTFSPPVIERGVEVDVYFSEFLHARYGDLVGPGLLNVAIGNPHETEVHYLIPAAQAAVKYGGFVDYHSYWTRNATQGCIADHWQWHAGRWMEWDNVFREAGVYPRYVATEGGIVYADGCTAFNSGLGWKACGPFGLYLQDIDIYLNRVRAWNIEHANRCSGVTLFGYGNWGWDSFELGDGDVRMLAAHLGHPLPTAYAVGEPPERDQQLEHIFQFEEYLRAANYLTVEQRNRLRQKLTSARADYYLRGIRE